jgi:hypothetical protein
MDVGKRCKTLGICESWCMQNRATEVVTVTVTVTVTWFRNCLNTPWGANEAHVTSMVV